VQSSGDWPGISAWNRTTKAILYTFPHWTDELLTYAEYILRQFSAYIPGSHSHIIKTDKAIHSFIGEPNDVAFSDVYAFGMFETSFL
jgi:hypothetical protein